MLPCQLDLILHLVNMIGKQLYDFQECKDSTYGTICGPVHLLQEG